MDFRVRNSENTKRNDERNKTKDAHEDQNPRSYSEKKSTMASFKTFLVDKAKYKRTK